MVIKTRISKVTDKDNKLLGFKYQIKASVNVGKTKRIQKHLFLTETKKKAQAIVRRFKKI